MIDTPPKPEDGWTSEGLGWILTFVTQPDGIDNLPVGRGLGTKGEALRQHFSKCFARLDEMIEDGVQVTARMTSIGAVGIIGPQDVCMHLKEKVEAEGLALMIENRNCIFAAE